MNLLTKQKETYRLRKQTYGCRGEGQLGTLERSCTHCYIKMENQQKPTVQDSAQCYVPAWMGGGLQGEWIHVYV